MPNLLQIMADAQTKQEIDLFYGDTLLVNDARQPLGLMSEVTTRSLPDPLRSTDYLLGMRVVHQSFVPKRILSSPYEMQNLCADYLWAIQILKKSKHNYLVPTPVMSRYLAGGISKKRHWQSLKDRFWVMRNEFGLFPAIAAHIMIVFRAAIHRIIRTGREKY
jgi:hypothetical protein